MGNKYRYIVRTGTENLGQDLLPFMRYLLSSGGIDEVILHELKTMNESDERVLNNPNNVFIFLEQLIAKGNLLFDMDVEIYIGRSAYRITAMRGWDLVINAWEVDILSNDDSILTLPELAQFKPGDISTYNKSINP